MSVYDISTIKRSIAIYFRLSSFRRASKETGVPRSTLHGWISRFGRGIDGRRGIVRRNSIYRRRKRDLVKSIVRNELDVNPFHTLSTLKRSTRTSLSLSSLSRVVSDIDYFLQKVYWRVPPRDVSHELAIFDNDMHTLLHENRHVLHSVKYKMKPRTYV
jgi:transposase